MVNEVVVRLFVIGGPSLGAAGAAAGSMALRPPRRRLRPLLLKVDLPRPLRIGIYEPDMLLSLLSPVSRV